MKMVIFGTFWPFLGFLGFVQISVENHPKCPQAFLRRFKRYDPANFTKKTAVQPAFISPNNIFTEVTQKAIMAKKVIFSINLKKTGVLWSHQIVYKWNVVSYGPIESPL